MFHLKLLNTVETFNFRKEKKERKVSEQYFVLRPIVFNLKYMYDACYSMLMWILCS